ncbi:MFS family permease [Kocuria rhizophila]
MKSFAAPALLVVTAVLQAMGVYPYVQDGITLAGQLLFPILFALTSMYLSRKGRPGVFGTAHMLVLILAVVLVVLSLVGMSQQLPYLYPTMIIYYLAFVLLVVECGLRIAGLPKKERPSDPQLDDDAPAF